MPLAYVAQAKAAIVEGRWHHHRPRTWQWRPQLRSVGTALAAAVAVCWHRTAMALAPVKLVQQWSVEGGALHNPIGLDVKYIDTAGGAVGFVRLENNSDLMLKAVAGNAQIGALRRSRLFILLAKRLAETVADQRWTPGRAPGSPSPPQSRTRPLPQSRSLHPAAP